MTFAVPPLDPVGLAIEDSEALLPVARAYCIGRNYADHSIEMGGNPDREEPFFFTKPATAIVPGGGEIGPNKDFYRCLERKLLELAKVSALI